MNEDIIVATWMTGVTLIGQRQVTETGDLLLSCARVVKIGPNGLSLLPIPFAKHNVAKLRNFTGTIVENVHGDMLSVYRNETSGLDLPPIPKVII